MRVLVTGGGGQIANAVVAAVTAPDHVIVKSHAELDIADEQAVMHALKESAAEWLINAAAYTGVDLAEEQSGLAIAVNDTAVGVLTAASARHGCRLLHLSTDFVFDGKSNRAYLPCDKPNPLSVYGKSKWSGELRVLAATQVGVVLRTAWVYAAAGKNFPLTMLRLMREKDQVRVVCDQIGTPTLASGIAAAVWSLIKAGVPGGVYHWTDLGVASWYDFAVAIQDEALARGLLQRAVPVIPIPSSAYPTRARRPTFSVLDTSATRSLIKVPARHWRHNLRTMLDGISTP